MRTEPDDLKIAGESTCAHWDKLKEKLTVGKQTLSKKERVEQPSPRTPRVFYPVRGSNHNTRPRPVGRR